MPELNLPTPGVTGGPVWASQLNAAIESVNSVVDETSDVIQTGRLSEDELSATFVRFLDENGDPLPPGSLVTITVNTTTGDIDDITFEEA